MQLSRDLSVNKNTAWLLQMKIRTAMREGEFQYFQKEKPTTRVTMTGHFAQLRGSRKHEKPNEQSPFGGYWGLLKRALIGQYHRIDESYLYRYVDEITFKFARKKIHDKGFHELLHRALRL